MPEVDYYICPNCDNEVRVGSRRCYHCEPKKAWERDEIYDGTELPLADDEFDYDDFVRREFGNDGKEGRRSPKEWFWAGVALGLLIVLGWLTLSGIF